MEMTEAWFNPAMFSWIPGTLLGCLAGLWGAIAGMLAPAGKARRLVMFFGGALIAASAALLVLGVVAFISGQPYGIWYGLGLAGLIGTILIASLLPVIRLRYRQAEQRRMAAEEKRSGELF